MRLRLHRFLPCSRANGPGNRAVIWTQGCTLGCPGCFNPGTHATNRGDTVDVSDLSAAIQALNGDIEGITISGGEPLQQRRAVTELVRLIKERTPLSVILFSGFTWEEISLTKESRRRRPDVIDLVDVLIAGRYDQTQRVAAGLRGSTNKTLHFLTSRYSWEDFEGVPPAEVIIGPDGELELSGIEPLRM